MYFFCLCFAINLKIFWTYILKMMDKHHHQLLSIFITQTNSQSTLCYISFNFFCFFKEIYQFSFVTVLSQNLFHVTLNTVLCSTIETCQYSNSSLENGFLCFNTAETCYLLLWQIQKRIKEIWKKINFMIKMKDKIIYNISCIK